MIIVTTVMVIMRTVRIIVTTTITVTLLVEPFHCRSDPRLKEMLAKFNIYVENVGGGSVSLKKTIRSLLLIACSF